MNRLREFFIHERPWDKQLQLLLILVVAINVVPHGWTVPYWATLTALSAIVWKLLYLERGTKLPNRLVLTLSSIVASAAVYKQYGTILGVEPASALLVMLTGLKLLETNRYRDAMLLIFTSYFLLMTHLLISQSLLATLFMAFDILFITTLMFHLHKQDRRKSVRSFRPAVRMFALIFPMWVLFFVLFPRFTAAFWDPKPPASATGFSDSLNPGLVEQLAENDDPAFRATFTTARLHPERLYWRGGVLSISDGLKWTKRSGTDTATPPASIAKTVAEADYEIYLEPGFNRWLFTLDYVLHLKAGDWLTDHGIHRSEGFSYRSTREYQTRIVYKATSSLEAPDEELKGEERSVQLQLPTELSDRLRALALQLDSKVPQSIANRNEALARHALDYFQDHNFKYTLHPSLSRLNTGPAQLDEFIFDKKRGFCEHYAAAFSTLMRLMKVPSRIVVGFQGGKYNDYGNYVLVRHSDAHAWSEIWSEDTRTHLGRWMRFDPTQVVAPLRLQLGGDYNRMDPETLASGLTPDEIRSRFEGSFSVLGLKALAAWDALQMKWNAFLINYDLTQQLELLQRLGIANASVILLIVFLVVTLGAVALVFILALRLRARRPDPLVRAWKSFCAQLAKAGIERGPIEGPLLYTERAAALRPRAAEKIRTIATLYIELKYGNLVNKDRTKLLNSFRREVRRFSVR